VGGACRNVEGARSALVLAGGHRGKPVGDAKGVSIYVPLGGVSYFLAQTVHAFRSGRQSLTVGRLMRETAKLVSRRYKQTPRLECPTSQRGQKLL
jgi:hypothetical protein